MDCHNCFYQTKVAGSTHFCCVALEHHPQFDDLSNSEKDTIKALLMFGNHQIKIDGQPVVDVNEYGKKMGWCSWPLDFDPAWINSCQLYCKVKDPNWKDVEI